MREFIRRALQKTSKMNADQVQSLLSLVTEEYELLDAVLDSLGTGVLVCDPFHILVQNNKAATRILPFEYHDVQDRPVWACIKDRDIAEFVQETIENEETVTAREFSLDEFTGSRFLSISVMPLVRSKQVRGTIITIEDITEKKGEEVRNRRLESLASLTNLAATVAHEIKNPLGSISIYVQLLRKATIARGIENEDPALKYLGVIDEEIDRLNRIVVDFLFAVRPVRLEPEPLDPNELFGSLAAFYKEECERSEIDISCDLDRQLPKIWGDERLLRQLFINLIKNAMAALSGGGSIVLKTRRADDFASLIVSDNGPGIPADVLPKIFEPYFTTKIDGTGLGLTMAYKVVKEHGGDIRVQSEIGSGTSFTVKLPILRRAQRMITYEEDS